MTIDVATIVLTMCLQTMQTHYHECRSEAGRQHFSGQEYNEKKEFEVQAKEEEDCKKRRADDIEKCIVETEKYR